MTERGGVHEHRRVPSVIRGITSLQEEEIANNNVRLDILDNLHAAIVHVDVFLLIPSPDILNQGLEAQDGAFGSGGMESTALTGAEEDVCI